MDLNAAVLILVGVLLLRFGIMSFYEAVSVSMRAVILSMSEFQVTLDNVRAHLINGLLFMGGRTWFFFVGMLVVAVGINLIQVGFLFSTEKIKPDLNKLNVIKGIQQFFGVEKLNKFAQDIGKSLIIGITSLLVIRSELNHFFLGYESDSKVVVLMMLNIAFKIGLYTAIVLIILAIFDYVYQYYHNLNSLKMTKQEVKDELKDIEGDPKIKGRRRQIQLEMARQRMMSQVPEADVVITNPTHFAVAIKYDRQTDTAPRVIAKGAGIIAQKIKEIARQNNIPLHEDKPLARELYRIVDVGEEIPEKLYKVVAEVLAFVYSFNRKRKYAI